MTKVNRVCDRQIVGSAAAILAIVVDLVGLSDRAMAQSPSPSVFAIPSQSIRNSLIRRSSQDFFEQGQQRLEQEVKRLLKADQSTNGLLDIQPITPPSDELETVPKQPYQPKGMPTL
jgi:hypothetical protein